MLSVGSIVGDYEVVKNLGTWWLTGRGQPSPYFEPSGRPRAEPMVLTPEARARLADAAS